MAESFSVKAILSAQDSGFSSTLKSASGTLDSLGAKLKSGFGMGIFQGMGQQAFSALSNGARELIGEISASNAAWKTFDQNMKIAEKNGIKLEGSISGIKKELQDYAAKTVYSASDMAQTYAQLAAVGVEGTTELVKGFGGLAAAAENPSQAMKTLSQQGVQMAAKPTVAWQDFKLMLEQSPAGMAAVAKKMGMSTAELVTAVQDGKVKTQDFFDTIKKVGGSGTDFEKMATEFKTVEQAIDGTKDALGNKLGPALEVLNKEGIGIVNMFGNAIDGIDADKAANAVSGLVDRVKEFGQTAKLYLDAAKDAFSGVGSAVGEAFSAVRESLAGANGELNSTESIDSFKGAMQSLASGIKAVAGFVTEHSDSIAKLIKYLPAIAVGFKGLQIAKAVVPGVASLASGIGNLASKVGGGLASKLFGVSKAQESVGSVSATSGAQMLNSAKAFALMGVGVLLVAAGFALLAQSAIALANAGGLAIGVMAGLVIGVAGLGVGMAVLLKSLAPMSGQLMPVATAFLAMGAAVLLIAAGFAILAFSSIALANAGGAAIGVMVGMVAAIALLAVGAAALGTALTAGAVGFLAFGAAVLMVGAGFALIGVAALLAANALSIIATVLPAIAASGLQGALSIAALGASLYVFALGAAVAGAACIILGAGLLLIGTAVLLAGAGMLMLGTGAILAATALNMIVAILPQITEYGATGASAIATLGAGMIVFAVGAAAAGVAAVVLAAGLVAVSLSIVAASVSVVVLAASIVALAVAVGVAAVAMALAAGGLALLNLALPATIANGAAASAAMVALSVGLLALGAGALVASAGLIALAASTVAADVAIVAFGVAMTAGAAGTLLMVAALKGVNSSMKSIAKNAKSTEKSLDDMQSSVNAVESGLSAVGNKAKSAMNSLKSAFDNTAKEAKSAGQKTGSGFASGIQSGMTKAVSVATSGSSQVGIVLRSGYSGAYAAGAYISIGFAQGMQSQLAAIRSAAAQMAAAADAAVRAKAKIHSPSRVADELGTYWGEGYVEGLESMLSKAWRIAEEFVAIPQVATPVLAGGFSGELYSDYEYSNNASFRIEVPLSIDGREFAKAEADYMQEELNRKELRANRKLGRV